MNLQNNPGGYNMTKTTFERNPTTINKKYTEYFIPTVLTAMSTNIASIVDSIIAGNMLGKNALSAINILSPITQLYFSLTIMFGLGASSVIAVAKGENNEKKADRTLTAGFASLIFDYFLPYVHSSSYKLCNRLLHNYQYIIYLLVHRPCHPYFFYQTTSPFQPYMPSIAKDTAEPFYFLIPNLFPSYKEFQSTHKNLFYSCQYFLLIFSILLLLP